MENIQNILLDTNNPFYLSFMTQVLKDYVDTHTAPHSDNPFEDESSYAFFNHLMGLARISKNHAIDTLLASIQRTAEHPEGDSYYNKLKDDKYTFNKMFLNYELK